MRRSSCGRATSGPTAGNMGSSWWRRKWTSGDSNCEAIAVRETQLDRSQPEAGLDAAADGGRTPAGATGTAAHAGARSRSEKPRTCQGIHAYGKRVRRDAHTSRGVRAGHQVYPRKSKDAAARRGKRSAVTADKSGRLARSHRVCVARAAVLEYLLSSQRELRQTRFLGDGGENRVRDHRHCEERLF